MKICVTGCAGYIGSVLVSHLLCKGHKVVGLDSLLYGEHSLLGFYGHPDFTFHKGDIRNLELVTEACKGCEAIINLAALVGESICVKDEAEAESVNVHAVEQLINVARRQGINYFFHASTCSIYGVNDQSPAHENSPLLSTGVYSKTKIASERMVLSAKGINTIIMRFATAYGVSPRMRFDLLLNEFVGDVFTKRRLLVYTAQSWRPFVHVRDIAMFISLLLERRSNLQHRIYNIGGHNRRKVDLVRAVQRITGLVDKDVEFSTTGVDPRSYQVDFNRIRTELMCEARYIPEDGIAEVAKALQDGLF